MNLKRVLKAMGTIIGFPVIVFVILFSAGCLWVWVSWKGQESLVDIMILSLVGEP